MLTPRLGKFVSFNIGEPNDKVRILIKPVWAKHLALWPRFQTFRTHSMRQALEHECSVMVPWPLCVR